MIGLNTSKTDKDDACKVGSVCCVLSPVPWSQLRSEIKEHFIGWCCQPSRYYSFQFFLCPVTIRHIVSLIITRVNIYNHFLIKLQKRCYATALVQNFVPTFPEAILLHAGIFYILYCSFSVPQSLGIFTYTYSDQIYLRFLHVLQFL